MKETIREKSEAREEITVGEVVARDYRTASIFEKSGIDFCCGGKVTVASACRERGLDKAKLYREIEAIAEQPSDGSADYAAWELPALADHIVDTHHVYLKENTASIAVHARKIAQVHGAHHPEVIRIADIFQEIATDMALHLRNEEEVLFPAIKRLAELGKGGGTPKAHEKEELRATLAMLGDDHDQIGAAIHEIRRLADGYKIPDGVCNTFMITYRELKEFEDDLHKHVHLENNILFPKAARL